MKTLTVLAAVICLVVAAPLDEADEGAPSETEQGSEAPVAEGTEAAGGEPPGESGGETKPPGDEGAEQTSAPGDDQSEGTKPPEEGGGDPSEEGEVKPTEKVGDGESKPDEGASLELREVFMDLLNEIPIAEMKKFAILQLHENYEFREAVNYMKSEKFVEMVHDLEMEPEVVELKAFFKEAGLDLDEYSEMVCSFFRHMDFNGEEADEGKAHLGNFMVGIRELIPVEKFMFTFDEQRTKSEVFRKFIETITSERAHELVQAVRDLEQFQTIQNRLKEMGIDIEPVFDKLYVAAGWAEGEEPPDEGNEEETDKEEEHTVEPEEEHTEQESEEPITEDGGAEEVTEPSEVSETEGEGGTEVVTPEGGITTVETASETTTSAGEGGTEPASEAGATEAPAGTGEPAATNAETAAPTEEPAPAATTVAE